MKQVAQMIIGGCINRNEFNREYNDYLHGNSDLAIDMMNLISGVKEYLSKLLKLNIDRVGSYTAKILLENDSKGLISSLDNENKKYRLAIILLGKTSSLGYGRLKLSLDAFTKLPSYYALTKDCPIIDPLQIKIVNYKQDEEDQDVIVSSNNSNIE